jgi:hypothetical protein
MRKAINLWSYYFIEKNFPKNFRKRRMILYCAALLYWENFPKNFGNDERAQ